LKPRLLALLAGLASLGFAWWLIAEPHTSRELFLCMVAWVLGFWVATGIRRSAPPEGEEEDGELYEEEPD
jgi:hypothetical protein